MYHNVFYQIVEIALSKGNEKLVLNILFKLGLIAGMWKCWNEICKNDVFLKNEHVHSLRAHISRIVNLIERVTVKDLFCS
jgi:hypothetical protein